MTVTMEYLIEKGAQFNLIENYIELWDAPMPDDIDGDDINCAMDLINASRKTGSKFGLYLPSGIGDVTAECEGEQQSVSTEDFIIWQLQQMIKSDLHELIMKVDCDFDTIVEDDEEYNSGEIEGLATDSLIDDYGEDSIKSIEWFQSNYPEELYTAIYVGIYDPDNGLGKWLETDLVDNYELKSCYDSWDCKLMTVAQHKFYPYFEPGDNTLNLEGYVLSSMYIRNYDETPLGMVSGSHLL